MNTDHLTAALHACAAGLYPLEAGVALLTSNGTFLQRGDFTTRFITCGTSDGTPMAAIDWDAAITTLNSGGLPCSGGERRILQLAASLAGGIPVRRIADKDRAQTPRGGEPLIGLTAFTQIHLHVILAVQETVNNFDGKRNEIFRYRRYPLGRAVDLGLELLATSEVTSYEGCRCQGYLSAEAIYITVAATDCRQCVINHAYTLRLRRVIKIVSKVGRRVVVERHPVPSAHEYIYSYLSNGQVPACLASYHLSPCASIPLESLKPMSLKATLNMCSLTSRSSLLPQK